MWIDGDPPLYPLKMSVVRRSLLSTSSTLHRSFSTSLPQKSSSNLPFVLLGVGTVSAAAYWYMESQTFKPKQEKSPFDPQNFLDFKLKKIVPYNHNTSRSFFSTLEKILCFVDHYSALFLSYPTMKRLFFQSPLVS